MPTSTQLNLTTKKAHFQNPLYLDSGRIIDPYDLVYETYGTLNKDKSNAILVMHALTGSHHAAGIYEGDRKKGWWDLMIGSGKSIDTDRFFVICVNVIGSCYGSTGPASLMFDNTNFYRFKFPVVTIQDMIKAINILIASLQIKTFHAVIGGSMGGMQTLSYAVEYPRAAKLFIPISCTYKTSPMVIAVNKVMKEAILLDPEFKNGLYSMRDKPEFKGLQIARMLGFTQYLTCNTMETKFGRNYVSNEGFYDMFGRFEIDRYLEYNGQNFTSYFDPLSYLYLLKALNIYDVSLHFDSLQSALSNVQRKILLVCFSGDCMFTLKEHETLYLELKRLQKDCELKIIESTYGHDSFLVEVELYGHIIKEALERLD
ncbi:homoserine O-acetyltransferase [Helicobacter sp. 13S00401-1]|uniref:homoserine O-acetyltransferase MetX n=1 Tax=Helicobacter sp. 13S00401-1 TaxID=1905758 RepID=UPI000BA5576C|nr:homoserine O-acetyltransferase [Helicobacter sp. 13S00401-1]PAF50983.1 homoserine O-acetyltransferase [Helicobacter sp. 13S00401-1]